MVERQIPLSVQIKSVEREIAMRRAVYPKRVATKAMKQETADHEIAAMEAVLGTLRSLERSKGWLQPCPDECDHSGAEHAAFDDGVVAGENGDGEDDCPETDSNLCEAWLAGYSVGSLNREKSNESTTANNRD
jgi:hypothetical protein